MGKILWRKKCWSKISCRKKTRAKMYRQKYLIIWFVFVIIKGWNYVGEQLRVNVPSFPSPTKSLMSGLVPFYRLPYRPKLWSWSSSFVPCRYLPAQIIPTLYHDEHELNSQIFLKIYFCTRFFATRNFASTFFASQNFAHLFWRVLFLCYQKYLYKYLWHKQL